MYKKTARAKFARIIVAANAPMLETFGSIVRNWPILQQKKQIENGKNFAFNEELWKSCVYDWFLSETQLLSFTALYKDIVKPITSKKPFFSLE